MRPSVGSVYRAPAVQNSDLPGLLGLASLRDLRVILDLNKLTLHFCGPGDYDLEKSLPPGTDSYPLELAPSGHLLLPCSNFEQLPPLSAPIMTLLSTIGVSTTTASPAQNDSNANTTTGITPQSAERADLSGGMPLVLTPATPPPSMPPTVQVLHSNTTPEVPKSTP